MQQLVKIELTLYAKQIEKKILSLFTEIIEGYIVESNDILEDLNPLFSQLSESDQNQVKQALNKYFKEYEFVKAGGFWLEEEIEIINKDFNFTLVYKTERENNNYKSILKNLQLSQYREQNQIPEDFVANLQQLIKLNTNSLLVFDLLDQSLDLKDLSQIEILTILLKLFYCSSTFNDKELIVFEQLIGSLLQKQLYEITYYIENIKNNDLQNYKSFVEFLQKSQLLVINESNRDLQIFLEQNERYKILLINFSKEIINIKQHLQLFISQLIQIPIEQCQYNQIISYISNVENLNDQLNDLYLLIVFYYWKKYCIKYNLQLDLKNQEDSLPNLTEYERKLKFIERYLNKQRSNSQDKIYLFVIHRIYYFIDDIDFILCKDIYQQFINTIANNLVIFEYKEKQLIEEIMKDKQKFQEYWKIVHSLQFYNQQISIRGNQISHLITSLLWISKRTINLFKILNIITYNNKKNSFLATIQQMEDELNQMYFDSNDETNVNILKLNFLRIISAQFPQEEENYYLLKSLLDNYSSLLRVPMVLEANKFMNNKLNSKSISFFAQIGKKITVIYKVFPASTLTKLAQEIFIYMTTNNQNNIYECLLGLKSIFALKQAALADDLQCINILTKNFSTNLLGYLILINKNKDISLTSVKWTIYAIFHLFQKIDQYELKKVETQIDTIFKDSCYNFPFIFNCLRNNINLELINKLVQLQYYLYFQSQKKLLELSQEIFQQDEKLYEEWFRIQRPAQYILSIEYLKVKKIQSSYPKQIEIPLEDFNISLSEYDEQEQKQVLSDWIYDMNNTDKFKQIIPLFFNIIKRGESPQDLLILANQILQQNRIIADGIGSFNLKSLFQIFYNNANEELQVILMKFFSKEYPIPFLYQNPNQNNINSNTELLLINSNVFYLIEQGYTIINFSLSKNQKKIGKTELINQVFYEREKFETSDTCKMNSHTIDIMFDFEFNNSRNYIVADAHGPIISEILIRLLPFFQFWIVQMDSQKELQENFDQIQKIFHQMGHKMSEQLEVCFIVRNTEETELTIDQQTSQEIEGKQITILYLHNLTSTQIDKQFKISQIQQISQCLFKIILDHKKRLIQNDQQFLNQKSQFLQILKQFNQQYAINIDKIIEHENLVNKIQSKLNEIVKLEDGFYSQSAFPIRRIQWDIKKLRNYNYELCMKPIENKMEIEKNKQQMQVLEKQIQKQRSTELLRLFCEIFTHKHYYIIYLWIVDKIRSFNEQNLIDLQQKDCQLNEKFNKLKQEKHKIKQKYSNNLHHLCEDLKNKEIKDEMSKLRYQMEINGLNISQRNIGIELFWRELISLRRSNQHNLDFDPVETLSQLIRKGESLEFLDGDTLSINSQFLFELENKIIQNKQQKILVISILGPQSSGKSTILNKIFGCHFWASVGRCTKGIHLQILQVQNKQIFQNRFDQILILDTEGLQNPNQIDSEFDKKIALFVLSISDIIMINVKGEINQQFKNLVEMCIFTLGHLKDGLSTFKQLSWFFNQNDNYKNVSPFRQQIKDLAQKLKLQWNEDYIDQQEDQIDYADILDIKDNISGLGFASDQKHWSKNGWNQSVNNHTFSREAYQQGIRMIKQFISKLQDQVDPLNNFNHFLQSVQRNWESIEKLPDLIEFSELIQHQQNLIMKNYFDDLWRIQDITTVSESIIQGTLEKIKNQKQIFFDLYKQIKLEKENEIDSTYTQITSQIVEKMNQFKSENKIQKKIMSKYLKKLETLIKTEEVDCKLKIDNLIQKYEGEYQQKKGYIYIDNFIQSILADEAQKKIFQKNDNLIEQQFKIKWDQFISDAKRTSDQQYLQMVDTHYKALKQISSQYVLNTRNESEYFNFFRDEIIRQNPYDIQNKEQDMIFQLFKREFQETEQFIAINNSLKSNLSYVDIFHQKISEKLEKTSDQLLDLKQFYTQNIIFQVVPKLSIQNYLNNQFEIDFQQFLKKHELKSNFKTLVYNFISILDYLEIQYERTPKDQLNSYLNNNNYLQQFKQLFVNKSTYVYEAFQDLKKSLQFNNNNNQEIDLSGNQFYLTFKETYQNCDVQQITIQSWNNTLQLKKELLQKYIIIDTKIDIQPSQNTFQEQFNYIKFPQITTPTYFTNFPKQFNTIMIDLNGWKTLYKELYNLIKHEIGCSKSKIEQERSKSNILAYMDNNKEDEIIQSFNPYLVKSIMQKIQNNIKIKYNNQFAQFGVILTDVGERCICYYSILIIWRFLCNQRWNSKSIQQRHQENYKNELMRCIAEINQDNEKQGCIKAREIVNKIQIFIKYQFLERTQKEVQQEMSQINMSNVELIAKLDKELLIDANENTFEDDEFKKKILAYTTDHKSYIINYTQNILTKHQNQLLNRYSKKYKEELQTYLKGIQENAAILYPYIKDQKKEVRTIKYFYQDGKQKDGLFYENYLFKLLMQSLLGSINDDEIDIIDNQFKEIFQVSNYTPVNCQFTINQQFLNQQEQQVYNLKSLVGTLINEIGQILINIKNISLNQNDYKLDVVFGKLKLQMNGCEYICPCCKRKCDQENDNDHNHQCQNGHQIRGINGILITKGIPSLFTCEEIFDDCMLKTLETNRIRTWKEVKNSHSNWVFKNFEEEQNRINKEKWKNVWNVGLGKIVCSHLEKQLNCEVAYKQKQECENQTSNIHYILMLDDSGSMKGDKWNQAINGALYCIKSLEKADCAKVSVIIFNTNARIVAECQQPIYNEINKNIKYNGGGTCFEPPFILALQLILKYKDFNKFSILFYTDGEAAYPSKIVDQFCQLPQDIRTKINLIACSGEKSSQSLALLIEKFSQQMQSAQLKNSVQPLDVQKVWTEVVSQNIHSQLA